MALADELAQLAARHIAEEGLSYGQAKRKAAKQAGVAEHSAAMPSNEVIEQALRDYQSEFMADTQPLELLRLRQLAITWLQRLQSLEGLNESCNAVAVGAVVNGTAGEHSPVHLHVFTDEVKHFEIALLNQGIDFEITTKKVNGLACPVWVTQDQGVPIALTLLPRLNFKAPTISVTALASTHPQSASAAQLQSIITKTC
jgi:hypothetical protein